MSFGSWLMGDENAPGFFGSGQYGVQGGAYALPQIQQMQQMYQQMFGANTGMSFQQPTTPSGPPLPAGASAWGGAARQAQPQLGPVGGGTMGASPGPASFRDQQQQLAGSLFGTLNGTTPSVAQQQLQNTTQGNVANAYAMAAASGNPAAARMAAMNAAHVNQEAAGQGALLRAQEIQNAQGGLSGVLGGARGQDISGSLGAAQGLLNTNQTQLQASMAMDAAKAQAYQGAAQNSLGGKVLSAAAQGFSAAAGAGALGGKGKAHGGLIEGYASGGDSEANDTVPALLSPGEIVLPRSISLSEDAPEKAKAFVEAIRRRKMKKRAAS